MKRIFCVCCVLALLCLTTLSVYAADTQKGMNLQVSTNVINRPAFSMEIPSTIPMGDLVRTAESSPVSRSFSVKVTGADTLSGQRIEVFVGSDSGSFAMYCDQVALPFAVYGQAEGGTPLASGDRLAVFEADGEQAGRIVIDQKDITASGVYAGTIRFTVKVTETGSGE